MFVFSISFINKGAILLMNTIHSTQDYENKFWELEPPNDENFNSAADYLAFAEHFRSFPEGLTILLQKSGYSGEDTIKSKTQFLYNKFQRISYEIHKRTIQKWFSGKTRPNYRQEDRERIFALCFALNLSIQDVNWFFSHVVFDRSFNCRCSNEAIYYYCFLNHLSYSHASKLIDEFKTFSPTHPMRKITKTTSTKSIMNDIRDISCDEELMEYLSNNTYNLSLNNQTARNYINKLLDRIKGKDSDKQVIKSIKSGMRNPQLKEQIQQCGYVVQEYIKFYMDNNSFIDIDISSINFMLSIILNPISNKTPFSKNKNLVKAIQLNFPNKQKFSQILSSTKNPGSPSYDSIRKILILLYFYSYWFSNQYCDLANREKDFDAYDTYVDQTNDLLESCGFDELYYGNPYDWLFLYASRADIPLDTFRGIVDICLKSKDRKN